MVVEINVTIKVFVWGGGQASAIGWTLKPAQFNLTCIGGGGASHCSHPWLHMLTIFCSLCNINPL